MQGIDHYENFPVASWLCPPALRPPILAIYNFARTADDIADEGDADAPQRLQDLHAFRDELLAFAHGMDTNTSPQSYPLDRTRTHRWSAVFGPLVQAMHTHHLPVQQLLLLLDAFEQDVVFTQRQQRYSDRTELLAYCERSANPIGRLLLHLYQVDDEASLQQSDAICSALQLINFWQDRRQDLARGRDYLPQNSDMRSELAFAHMLMHRGVPLVHRLPGRAGWELRLVVQGGLRILEQLYALSDAVLAQPHLQPRPRLKALDIPRLLWRAAWMSAHKPRA